MNNNDMAARPMRQGGTMVRALAILGLCLGVAGCAETAGTPKFEGQMYRGSAKAAERSDRQYFLATVSPVSQSLDGARQAAEYEGIKHCIRYYGTSDIEWEVGPKTPREALRINGDTLTYMGRCSDW